MTCRYLHGVNQKKRMNVEGRLNLVDLAGSERLDKSHSTGEALEEAKFINRSLSALSNVFISIRNNQAHVNFRDTKLTLLLKDCLSKEGKTLMFVNLSPIAESAQESVCSLNFAATANQCKQGQAKRKVTKVWCVCLRGVVSSEGEMSLQFEKDGCLFSERDDCCLFSERDDCTLFNERRSMSRIYPT